MLTTIQIVLLVFILFAISRVLLRIKEKVISTQVGFFWFLIWLAAFVGVILPGTTTKLASYFGVGRGVDVIVYLSLALLFYLVFRIYVMIEDLRHEITYLIRQLALQNSSHSSVKNRQKTSKK
ncbi:MAG: hypothetical protein UT01_C0057G0002 [Candidatus Daviesbacteria bacterium GW2011_GWA1_38_7]|uniref:DUF2304 domain-containing protein n=3 Tax=Candidatus Curtissiibacteriota TaxID=1752717 RepID=A0A1F5HPQ3_9BACT|nr:MAG: hypothetical protein UT01_C0057G0002 [Candidatus Daviesbacteria bacterium GW2011_GWA1_38_7]KKQ89832.1 MAG: hypothetical protein UT12_C0007G0029 [Candidatus Curtissbacteria bacterium GW2011_GWC2_38_9]KKS04460.1 MAG: hypothetical protein UU56_C0006G0064 [Candidatus Curtissbacteria bacterium GW2011_GWA2_41_24]OGE06121.1 MAG: hypothetical protein A2W70_05245 [Candidatus Curtissbacteria bacterium RIFCSPLOWO2_02_41_11]